MHKYVVLVFFHVCVIRKKGYGVYIHNKKSLHALDKTQSKLVHYINGEDFMMADIKIQNYYT
jgi:hypothetical protein